MGYFFKGYGYKITALKMADDFARANSNDASFGDAAKWICAWTPNGFNIVGGQGVTKSLFNNNQGSHAIFKGLYVFTDNYYVQAVFKGYGNFGGIGGLFGDADLTRDSQGIGFLYGNPAGAEQLFLKGGFASAFPSSAGALAIISYTLSVNDVVRLEFSGANCAGKVNGVTRMAVARTIPRTPPYGVGMCHHNQNAGGAQITVQWANWKAGKL